MQDTLAARKDRGAFFTPETLCDFVSVWAIRDSADRILEPSCGDAEFLLAAGRRIRALGELGAGQIHGVELHPPSAAEARSRLRAAGLPGEVTESDFFDYVPSQPFDAVVGNPPFIRYQLFNGDARAKGQSAAAKAGVELSGLASSWAPFVLHSVECLRPGGRLGLVLPAELMAVNYAAPVRERLLDRFAHVELVLFQKRVFPGVIAEVVLLLADGDGGTDAITVTAADDLAALTAGEVESWEWSPRQPGAKWLGATLSATAATWLHEAETSPHFTPLSTWGRTILGMVSGNNSYFVMTRADVTAADLPDEDLIPVVPPGSRHLRGLEFDVGQWEELVEEDTKPGFLFYPEEDVARPGRPGSVAARRYERRGRKQKVHEAYKCRVRDPWWRVPLVPVPDLLLTYMNYDGPRLVANRARMRHFNSVHGVRLDHPEADLARELLTIAFLNEVTLLGAELHGRPYGGGILKLEPKEADRLPVPTADVLRRAADDLRASYVEVERALADDGLDAAADVVNRVLLVGHLGYPQRHLRRLRDARRALFERRQSRAGSRG